nr:flagellar motor switch phosphatase FliY [Salsuginibacillus kocurii]
MNDDMLSQDEINELLKGVNNDDAGDKDSDSQPPTGGGGGDDGGDGNGYPPPNSKAALNVDDYLTTIEQDALGEIGNISFGSAATALAQLLNQKVDITTPVVSAIHSELLEAEFPNPHVSIHVQYTDGFEGTNLLVIDSTDAAIIADLMLGGDGTAPAEELSDMHLSAVQEAMNQMMGSASTSMSTVFNKRVDISPPGIDVLDVTEKEGTDKVPGDETIIKISFRLQVGDLIDSVLMQLVTVGFAKQMVEDLMNPPEEEAETLASPETSESEQIEPEPQPNTQPNQGMSTNQEPAYQQAPGGFSEPQQLGGHMNNRAKDVQPAAFSSFDAPQLNETETKNLNMLMDIPLEVSVELGRTKRSIREILEFSQGSIIELDKLAGEPVDILVNQKLIAKGEVVVIEENFGVRVTDIVSPEDRLKKLK